MDAKRVHIQALTSAFGKKKCEKIVLASDMFDAFTYQETGHRFKI
jgi:hypothetical protein